ncbi:ATP-binding protein [Arachidicoccus terrestris]|uniref:ATP-binding protein n=1 Tax=Arachidicoccus terrestris TaxID=2875539 RepID=UPI001CC6D3DC|nr:ATP-binding protein [Arachidicoccus terrestris]
MIRKYPIGIQHFREMREEGYLYVDKTKIIHQLVETGKYYFLSRPRRFGKSLLVDTLAELFSGSNELFKGLWIYDHWDFEKINPVIRFSFSNIGVTTNGIEAALFGALQDNAIRLGISLTKPSIDLQFRELIEKAAKKGNVVILIDEYDKPIIDFIDKPEVMVENRSIMKSFYSILKDSGNHIRLLLITGVSQFSHVSIFFDLNNLDNITLSTQNGAVVGITQAELDHYFAVEIRELQKKQPDILSQIKDWYNGYTWNLKDWVYNPFSLLKFMKDPVFKNYWYTTGTPTFLIKLLKNRKIYDVENIRIGESALSMFEPEDPSISSVLFQTGYLTIKKIINNGNLYELGYPNKEVKISLLEGLLSGYREVRAGESTEIVSFIKSSLKNKDIPGLINQLNLLIASIPYDHWNADTESIFNIITFLAFKIAGMDVQTEIHSSKGRCDLRVMTDSLIYVIELKLDGAAEEALQQIMAKGYLEPYMTDTREKLAVGISFSSAKRKVAEYLIQEL